MFDGKSPVAIEMMVQNMVVCVRMIYMGQFGDNYMCLVFPMPPCPACDAPLL